MALILAKKVLQSRKAISKMYASMAQINSVMMNMDHQLGRSCDGHVMVIWSLCNAACDEGLLTEGYSFVVSYIDLPNMPITAPKPIPLDMSRACLMCAPSEFTLTVPEFRGLR